MNPKVVWKLNVGGDRVQCQLFPEGDYGLGIYFVGGTGWEISALRHAKPEVLLAKVSDMLVAAMASGVARPLEMVAREGVVTRKSGAWERGERRGADDGAARVPVLSEDFMEAEAERVATLLEAAGHPERAANVASRPNSDSLRDTAKRLAWLVATEELSPSPRPVGLRIRALCAVARLGALIGCEQGVRTAIGKSFEDAGLKATDPPRAPGAR